MKHLHISLIALLLASSPVLAAPFDMTPEANLRIQQPPTASEAPAAATPVAPDLTRYLLPSDTVRFEGENDRRDYQVYLTQAQASSKAQLNLGYLNALVVAPENSRLRVIINRDTVLNVPVASSAGQADVTVDIPPGLLQPGFNAVSISADLRHRTDCDIGSTYQLWTDLNGAGTYLSFFGTGLGTIASLEDVPAIGFDANGQTRLRLVMPAGQGIDNGVLAASVVQALALDIQTPTPVVEIAQSLNETPEPGVLQVVMATAQNLPAGLGDLATQARSGPVAAFATGYPSHNVLVLSGPDQSALEQAFASVQSVADREGQATNTLRPNVGYARPVPMVMGEQTLSLAALGLEQVSFNGRRFVSTVEFALPADFYASNYGQARIRLNAAYASNVLPGSEVDIFVNGQIASSTPILRTGEDVRSLSVPVPMKGFRPGRNTLDLVIALRTDEDAVCAPGTVTVGTDTRLLLASGSTLTIPNFGRVGNVPNLAAFAGEAFPYRQSPPHLIVSPGTDGLAMGYTALARLAAFTGSGMDVKSVGMANPPSAEPAIFVGAYSQLPPETTRRIGVLAPYADTPSAEDESDVESTLQRWRSQGSSANSSIVGRFQNWVADLLDIKPESFGLPLPNAAYAPRRSDQAFALQRVQPEGGVWTLISAPDAATTTAGIDALMNPSAMARYSGYVTTLPASPAALEALEPTDVTFFEPQDTSLENLRNIAANWFSGHVMAYAIMLAILAIVLTIATHSMLRLIGRKPQ